MKIYLKSFKELSTTELYKILQLRNEVFVVEQNCVYQDADGKDLKALHLFIKNQEDIIAYLRIFKPGDYFKHASIGRVVTHPSYRGKNFGKQIMQKAIDIITNDLQENTIEISAQTYLKKFYNDLGFQETGNEYLEDGIPHVRMIYKR